MSKVLSSLVVCLFLWSCSAQDQISAISTKELKGLIAKDTIHLLDVRTPKEVKLGFIKGAQFVNYFDQNFKTQVREKFSQQNTIYVYCRSGNRSLKATKQLQLEGFKVVNVLGGYLAWLKEE